MKIKLDQVLDAIETADDAFTYFFDTQTGETVYLADYYVTGETDEALEAQIENSPGRYLRFPTKYEIHEYQIMEMFVDSLPDGTAKRELFPAIRRKGAFRRFKNGIRYHRLEQQWYNFRAEAFREIAIRWCRDHELSYEEEGVSMSALRKAQDAFAGEAERAGIKDEEDVVDMIRELRKERSTEQ